MDDINHKDGTVTRNGKRYGCHCDTANDGEIDGCVIDTGSPEDCILTRLPAGRTRRSKWTCSEWRKMPEAEQARRERGEAK